MYRFHLELADIDRSVYESLDLRVACHPSESQPRMILRVLSRALSHQEGLEFGKGLSTSDDAALFVASSMGGFALWIDVGIPSADRVHRASKASERVEIYTDKSESALIKAWSARAIHKSEDIAIVQVPSSLLDNLSQGLERQTTWYLTVQEGHLSVAEGEKTYEADFRRESLANFLARNS